MNKKDLSERDICSKYITPSLINSGWDLERQIREEVSFTDGRIIVRKKLVTRGERKRADYIGIAIPGISIEHILNLLISVPPLNEQKSIVEKIDQLIVLCDELENNIGQFKKRVNC